MIILGKGRETNAVVESLLVFYDVDDGRALKFWKALLIQVEQMAFIVSFSVLYKKYNTFVRVQLKGHFNLWHLLITRRIEYVNFTDVLHL